MSKKIKINLKVAKVHPMNEYRIGSVTVKGYEFKQYELTENEFKILNSKEGKAWVAIASDKKINE